MMITIPYWMLTMCQIPCRLVTIIVSFLASYGWRTKAKGSSLFFVSHMTRNKWLAFWGPSDCRAQEFLFIYLAVLGLSCSMQNRQSSLQHAGSLVLACEHLVAACGIKFPDQGLNLGPLRWEHVVLATGPLGKSSEPKILNTLASFSENSALYIFFNIGKDD